MKMLHCPHGGRAAILSPMVITHGGMDALMRSIHRRRACGHIVKRCAEWRCLA